MFQPFIDFFVAPFIYLYIIGATFFGYSIGTPDPQQEVVGAFGDPFLSIQLAGSPVNGYCLTTDGTNNSWSSSCGGGGGSSFGQAFELTTNVFSQSALAPTTTQNLLISGVGTSTFAGNLEVFGLLSGSYIHATGTATSTFGGGVDTGLNYITTNGLIASGSGGLNFHANNGTTVALLGGGGGSNATFYGGVNIDGATRLATSLTGLLKATSGTISAAVAGTDYENALSFTWPLIRSTNTISFGGLSTSTTPTVSHLPYWTGVNTFGSVATTSLTATSPLSLSNAISVIGSSASALSLATTTNSLFTGTPGQILAYGVSNGVTGWYGAATTTFSTGLTYSGGAVTVNTSQNIATLSNLTTNGVIYTSGSNGTLNVDSGALDVARGGTGATTFTNNRLLTGNGTSALVDEVNLTFDGSLLTVTGNASTTQLSASGAFYFPSSTTQSPTVAGQCAWDTTSGQFKCGNGSTTLVHSNGYIYQSFTWPSQATTTTATTTLQLGSAAVGETWNQSLCNTSSGSSGYRFTDNTNHFTYRAASTTPALFTESTNNTFTIGEKRFVEVGPLTASYLSCTIRKTITAD